MSTAKLALKILAVISSTIAIVASVIGGLGSLLITSYAAAINFYPGGLSATGSELYVWSALVFIGYYAVWLVIAFLVGQAVNRGWKSTIPRILLIIAGVALVGTAFLFITSPLTSRYIGFATFLIVGGLFIAFSIEMLIGAGPDPRRSRKIGMILLAVGILSPVLFSPWLVGRLQHMTFASLGIYIERADIQASGRSIDSIRSVATTENAPVFGCNHSKGDTSTFYGLEVLWNKAGDRALLAIPRSSGERSTVEVDAKDILIIKHPINRPVEACFALVDQVLFDTGRYELNDRGEHNMEKFIKDRAAQVQQSGLVVSSISVIGHADRSLPKTPGMTNQILSERRADTIAKRIAEAFHIPKDQISAQGKGDSVASASCPLSLPRSELEDCRAADRHVDIQMALILPTPKTQAALP